MGRVRKESEKEWEEGEKRARESGKREKRERELVAWVSASERSK